MDINENTIKEEVSNFVSSLQRLLPKKKEFIVLQPQKPRIVRLSDIHAEAKGVFPECFIGTKLVILRDIMDKVKLVQQYNFGRAKDTHRCYSQLINKEMEPKKIQDGLLIDSTGSATAIYTEVKDGYEMRLTSKIKDLVSSETEIMFERGSQKTLGSIRCTMKDVNPNTLKVVTHWMYQVNPEFGIGTELGIRPLTYPTTPDFSISSRYHSPLFTLSSTVSRTGFQICFFKQFAPDLRISTIVHEGVNRKVPPTIGLALHKSYENGSELKIFVDSQKCGGFTFQKDVLFHEGYNDVRVVKLVCSTIIDKQRRVRLGFGFNLDF